MSDGFLARSKRRRSTAGRIRIDRLTSALVNQWSDHPDAQEYIRAQWGARVLLAHVVNRRAQEAFYLARWLVVVGATIVPTLVAVGAQTHGTVATVAQVVAVILSLLVAAAAGGLQVTQMGQRWLLFRRLQFELEHAGWQLFTQRGEYISADPDQRFSAFVDRVERIMHSNENEYTAQIARLGRDEGSFE